METQAEKLALAGTKVVLANCWIFQPCWDRDLGLSCCDPVGTHSAPSLPPSLSDGHLTWGGGSSEGPQGCRSGAIHFPQPWRVPSRACVLSQTEIPGGACGFQDHHHVGNSLVKSLACSKFSRNGVCL